jgi:excisionase family DNA binding protein
MTLEDAATFLKCCPTTIKRRAKILHIPHKRLGSLWRFYRPDLEAWMRQDAA